jgi:hypothetical protein
MKTRWVRAYNTYGKNEFMQDLIAMTEGMRSYED